MARYEASLDTSATASGAAVAGIRAGAGQRMLVKELGIFMKTAVASAFGLVRATTPQTGTTTQLGQALDAGDSAAVGSLDTVWGTQPTAGTAFMRRIWLPATIGAGVIWTWPDASPLVINASAQLLIANTAGAVVGTASVYVSWNE